jgi:hypothetical protein
MCRALGVESLEEPLAQPVSTVPTVSSWSASYAASMMMLWATPRPGLRGGIAGGSGDRHPRRTSPRPLSAEARRPYRHTDGRRV